MRYLKKIIGCLVICVLLMPYSVSAEEEMVLYARAAVLMDADSGRVLYSKDGEKPYPVASTTKILTLIIALENISQDTVITASEYAASMPQVRLGVCKGERYKAEDLFYALMLESYNDAAVMIAEACAGSVEKFAKMMNQKAESLGCDTAHFVTPNGLDAKDDSGVHSASATDMALIMRYAVNNEMFCKITQTKTYSFSDCDHKRYFELHNKNALLEQMKGVISGKTGFTGDAGYCYVCALENNGRHYVIALLGCGWPPNKTYKWHDVKKLYDYGCDNYTLCRLSADENLLSQVIQVLHGEMSKCVVKADQISLKILIGKQEKANYRIVLDGFVEAPAKIDKNMGSLLIYINDKCVAESDYMLKCTIEKQRMVDIVIKYVRLLFEI